MHHPLRTLLLGALLLATAPAGAADAPRAPWFQQVRGFDGKTVLPRAAVLAIPGRIARIAGTGPEVKAPADAVRIDGRGKTLLPGLIDAHTHVFPGALEQALAFGVTTELDMMSDPKVDAR